MRLTTTTWMNPPARKPTYVMAATDAQEVGECVVFSTNESNITLTEEEISALCHGVLIYDEDNGELLQHPLKVLQNELSFNQTAISVMQIRIGHQRTANSRHRCPSYVWYRN